MKLANTENTTSEWYTPEFIIDAAHEVMGCIDLDPASSAKANEIVRAKRYITQEEDGLNTTWWGSKVFINPPGGKINNKSIPVLFWQKLMSYYYSEIIEEGIFLSFNIDMLQLAQLPTMPNRYNILKHTTCIFNKRLKYRKEGVEGFKSPMGASAITYVGMKHRGKFAEVFSKHGTIIKQAYIAEG